LLQKLTKQLKKKSRDWDEDHALDLVMNDMVADLDEEDLEDSVGITEEELQNIIDQSGLKETVANIQQEMRDDIDQITKDFEDTINDGLEDEPTFEEPKKSGLIDTVIEKRTVKSQPNIEEDDARFRKGPLWNFRTSHQDDDKVID